jgi:hypothetical protein
MSNNPIWHNDVLGDTIRYRGSKRFNRRMKWKTFLMRVLGQKKLRKRIKYLQSCRQDVIVSDGASSGSSPTGGLIINLYQDKSEYSKIGVPGVKDGKWIKGNEFSALANEYSHAYNQASNNVLTGYTFIKFPNYTEINSNEEIQSNHVENMARKIFFWLPKRGDSHFGYSANSRKENRQIRRILRIMSKNRTRAERIAKRKSANVQQIIKELKKLYIKNKS